MRLLHAFGLVLLLPMLPLTALAQEEGPAFVPAEKVGPGGKPDGVEWQIDAALNFTLSDNRNVIGQEEGTAVATGYKTSAQLDAREEGHETRNRALVAATLLYSPSVKDIQKTRDELSFESIYLYHIVDWFGPFARVSAQTAMLQGYDIRSDDGATYQCVDANGAPVGPTAAPCFADGDVTRNPPGRRQALTDPWTPTRFKQSLGFFVQPLSWQPLNIETRAGVGAREVLAEGQLAINDNADTPFIEVVRLRDVWQTGGEGVLELWGDIEEKRVSYRASVEVLVPFAQSDPPPEENKSTVDYTVVEMKAALAVKIVSWATLDYELGALREPLLLDAWQVRNQLLVNFGISAGNVPPPEGPLPDGEVRAD